MGHMNVQYYVHLFDQATWVLFDRVGLSASYFSATGRGMAALEQHLVYKREVFAGTVVTIYSRVMEVSDKTVRFVHTMEDGQGSIATCEMVGAHFDRAAHRAVSFPDDARIGFKLQQVVPE
jgi:acyl-CoA thioester hydrolase